MDKRRMIDPQAIVIGEDRQRQEFNHQKLEELKTSLLRVGQLQPIILTRDNLLVVGERRVRACIDLDMEVWFVYSDEADKLMLEEMELAENLYRSEYTPTEVILAKSRIRELREERGENSTVRGVAESLGESKSQTAEDIKLAAFVKAMPQAFEKCRTKTDVKSVVKRMERRVQWANLEKAAAALERADDPSADMEEEEEASTIISNEEFMRRRIASFSERLKVGDAYEELQKVEGVQIMLLDPPWGIDHSDKQRRSVHKDGKYEDDPEEFKEKFPLLCSLAYNAMAPDSHLYCFFGIVNFTFVYDVLEETGFHVNRRPIIVCKENIASTQVPDVWPGAGYEPVAMARKGKRNIVRRGLPDWFTCKWPTETEKKGHPSAKHPLAYANLLRRSAYPGDIVCDPMYGTGAAFVACEMMPELKLQWIGWDDKRENRSKALENLVELITFEKEEEDA